MKRIILSLMVICIGTSSITTAGESRLLAAAFSAVLPGAGEAYLGWRRPAEAFLIAEGAIWGSRFYMSWRADGLKDRYVNFAATHANSDPWCRDGDYYSDISRFWNSEAANQEYGDPYLYTGSKSWSWQSSQEMSEFEDLLRNHRTWDNRTKNVIALAVLNRAISIVYCLRANRHADTGPVSLNVMPNTVSVGIRW